MRKVIIFIFFINLLYCIPILCINQQRGNLIIRSKQANVKLYLNNMYIKTLKGPSRIDGLIPGLYNLKIEKENFQTMERKIRIRANANLEIKIDLSSSQSTIKYSSITGSYASSSIQNNRKRRVYQQDKFSIMGEFGLGNLLSIYGAYYISPFYTGAGIGYLYFNDEENDTIVHIVEPSLIFMTQINIVRLRLRTGIMLISDSRFNVGGIAYSISPDIMINLMNIYAGISLPVIIGKEGTGMEIGIGVGCDLVEF